MTLLPVVTTNDDPSVEPMPKAPLPTSAAMHTGSASPAAAEPTHVPVGAPAAPPVYVVHIGHPHLHQSHHHHHPRQHLATGHHASYGGGVSVPSTLMPQQHQQQRSQSAQGPAGLQPDWESQPNALTTSTATAADDEAALRVPGYTGPTRHGIPHGLGRQEYSDGSIYVGGFVQGRRHGAGGTFSFSNGDVYRGAFENDRKHGRGEYRWCDGSRYTGMWSNDQRCGNGGLLEIGEAAGAALRDHLIMSFASAAPAVADVLETVLGSQSHYQGSFLFDAVHGPGAMHFTCGSAFQGAFAKGMEHGPGELTLCRGLAVTAQWVAGEVRPPVCIVADGAPPVDASNVRDVNALVRDILSRRGAVVPDTTGAVSFAERFDATRFAAARAAASGVLGAAQSRRDSSTTTEAEWAAATEAPPSRGASNFRRVASMRGLTPQPSTGRGASGVQWVRPLHSRDSRHQVAFMGPRSERSASSPALRWGTLLSPSPPRATAAATMTGAMTEADARRVPPALYEGVTTGAVAPTAATSTVLSTPVSWRNLRAASPQHATITVSIRQDDLEVVNIRTGPSVGTSLLNLHGHGSSVTDGNGAPMAPIVAGTPAAALRSQKRLQFPSPPPSVNGAESSATSGAVAPESIDRGASAASYAVAEEVAPVTKARAVDSGAKPATPQALTPAGDSEPPPVPPVELVHAASSLYAASSTGAAGRPTATASPVDVVARTDGGEQPDFDASPPRKHQRGKASQSTIAAVADPLVEEEAAPKTPLTAPVTEESVAVAAAMRAEMLQRIIAVAAAKRKLVRTGIAISLADCDVCSAFTNRVWWSMRLSDPAGAAAYDAKPRSESKSPRRQQRSTSPRAAAAAAAAGSSDGPRRTIVRILDVAPGGVGEAWGLARGDAVVSFCRSGAWSRTTIREVELQPGDVVSMVVVRRHFDGDIEETAHNADYAMLSSTDPPPDIDRFASEERFISHEGTVGCTVTRADWAVLQAIPTSLEDDPQWKAHSTLEELAAVMRRLRRITVAARPEAWD